MARRRMFSLEIVDSDSFNEMSTEACVLYFHMVMHADNRGYVNCAKTIISNLQGANTGHLIELLNKRFVLKRKEDVYLIKHWYIHNDIPKGRVEETNYIDDFLTLYFDLNNAYTETPTEMPVKTIVKVRERDKGKRKEIEKENESEREKKISNNVANASNDKNVNYSNNVDISWEELIDEVRQR